MSQEKSRSALPISPQISPYAVLVEEGKSYRWCSCGLSVTQPWCDDSHVGTDFEPIVFIAPLSGTFYMCGCKRSENKPYCFGNCLGYSRKTEQPEAPRDGG